METKLTTTTNCKNCDVQHESSFEFCPHCGQKTDEELTVGVLFYNTISNYFSFDARFFKSFIPLMFKPGNLAKRFIEGKRLLYLHPAQMYLFISVVFFFLISFSIRDQIDDIVTKAEVPRNKEQKNALDTLTLSVSQLKHQDSLKQIAEIERRIKDSIEVEKALNLLKKNQKLFKISDEEMKKTDSIIKRQVESRSDGGVNVSFFGNGFNTRIIDSLIDVGASDKLIYKEMGLTENSNAFEKLIAKQSLKMMKSKEKGLAALIQTFYDSIPIALFFLLPVFAFILKLFYYNKGRFAHHLVFSFYYFSFLFTAFSIQYGLNLVIDIPNWIDVLVVLSTFIYLIIALRRFYSQARFLSLVKGSFITFVYFMFLIPFTVLVALAAFAVFD